jgi:hypothetical protein
MSLIKWNLFEKKIKVKNLFQFFLYLIVFIKDKHLLSSENYQKIKNQKQ